MDLDMYLASSSVNQLTSLLFYFKFWARGKRDFLIIDEPEENLHPKNQLKIINLLLKFSSFENNRVIITTHSLFVADAINNYMNLGFLSSQEGFDLDNFLKENKVDLSVKEVIEKESFGVYFFNGESAFENKSLEYGVYFSDFKEEQIKVKRLSENITDEIYKLVEEVEIKN